MAIAMCIGCNRFAPEIPEIVEATERSRHRHATAYVEAKFKMLNGKGHFVCSDHCQEVVDAVGAKENKDE